MKDSSRPTEPSDFSDVFASCEGMEPMVVVGGHAVNLWAIYFLRRGFKELEQYKPFTSKDLDLMGTSGHLEGLHLKLGGKVWRSEPRSPVIGRLELLSGDDSKIVEILHTVKGLDFKDLLRHVDVEVGGAIARVLLPHLMLKAKIANSVEIDQTGRNDVRHVRTMLCCTRYFVAELISFAEGGLSSQREVVNLLEELLGIISSSTATKAAVKWDIDFSRVWPAELINCELEKISRFVRHRLQEP